MRYLILDTDTGVDDALAILYALGLEARGVCRLVGVTCTFGNVEVETAVKNSRAVLDFLGRRDIPVFGGNNRLFGSGEEFVQRPICRIVHGENGLGNVDIPMPQEKTVDKDENVKEKGDKGASDYKRALDYEAGCGESEAVRFLTEMAELYGERLTVIATASMTNMAEWIQAHRDAALRTGTIAVMGGALTVPGNVNPFAEANILADPEAAKFLFESGLSFTMTGLDVTLKTNRRADQMEEKTGRWREEGGACGKVFADMLSYYCTNEAPSNGKKEGAIHDPMAVAAVFRSQLFHILEMNLTVETEGPSRGRTIGDLKRLRDRIKTARVCVDVDEEQFLNEFAEVCLGAFPKCD